MDEVMQKLLNKDPTYKNSLWKRFNLTEEQLINIFNENLAKGNRTVYFTADDGIRMKVYIRPDGELDVSCDLSAIPFDEDGFMNFLDEIFKRSEEEAEKRRPIVHPKKKKKHKKRH